MKDKDKGSAARWWGPAYIAPPDDACLLREFSSALAKVPFYGINDFLRIPEAERHSVFARFDYTR